MSENRFRFDFQQNGIISSRTSISLLQIFEKIISLVYVVNFRYTFNARPPVLLQIIFVDR